MKPSNSDALADDIREAARLLLENATAKEIIRKSGLDGEMDEKDQHVLIDLVCAQPFLQRFDDLINFEEHGLRPGIQEYRARRYNPYVVIAVAARVCVGEFDSVDDEAADEFIRRNMVSPEPRPKSEGRLDWPTRKLTFDEYYEVLKEVWASPELKRAAKKALKAIDEVGGDYLDRYVWKPAREELEDIPYRAMLRRGWISNPNFWSVIMQLMEEDFDIAERSKLFEKLSGTDAGEFARIEFGEGK